MTVTAEAIGTALKLLDDQKDKNTGLYSGMLVMAEQLLGVPVQYDAAEGCHYIVELK